MKVLVLTDSLALCRKHVDEIILYEQTYPYLLQKKFSNIDFVFTSIGGATIKQIFLQLTYYKFFKPDIVIIQCGIVDCAPRALTEFENKVLKKIPFLKLSSGIIYYLRKYRAYKYTSLNKFNDYCSRINKLLDKKTRIYCLGILPAFKKYEEKVPGIQNSVQEYNEVLKKHFTFISNSDFTEDAILSDFFHLNSEGHKIIFKKLSNIIFN
ncbi:MAG: hypothetical protein CMP65_05180 [Flavobacteriales bacterium]|nr:hypothetical protein [Flavobacteriales bacterium]